MTTRKKQLLILYILPAIAAVVSLLVHANTLLSLILFWGIPSLLLTLWAWKRATKGIIFSLVCTLFCMILNIIFYTTHQWYVVSMFGHRIFGIMAWEDIPYFFLWIYFPIIFWEHFYEKQKRERSWTRRMTKLALVFLFCGLVILSGYIWAPHFIKIPYFYLVILIAMIIIPLILEIYSHPKMGLKFIRIGLYFAYVGILYEITSIRLGQWFYPSTQFIGWVEILGQRFPFEEFLAWIVLGSSAILTWYEYFDDDNK